MSEVERIVDQLKRAFEGEAWHGPSVLEIIEGIDSQQAAARPFDGVHSIWEIVLHIAAWEGAVLRRLRGDRAELPTEEDWPPVPATTDEAWEQTREELKQGHNDLRNAVGRLDESRLYQQIIEGMSSVYGTLHGVIQHDLYHAGQIAILKKATSEGARNERASK
ncbi:MAG: DinB family protein [Pyrinomonadaceae bacterium]